jgi:predicted DNA-binding protein
MASERKATMISARVPAATVERLDFVARNTENTAVKNRSTAMLQAIETWLTAQEDRLRELGVLPKKAR